jgi:hypothetical protein
MGGSFAVDSVAGLVWNTHVVPLGYDVQDRKLVVNEAEAHTVRHIFTRYLALGSVRKLKHELDASQHVSKVRITKENTCGGNPFSRGALYTLLKNPLYIGKIAHQQQLYEGKHRAIIATETWEADHHGVFSQWTH